MRRRGAEAGGSGRRTLDGRDVKEIVEERVVATGPAAAEARPERASWLYRRFVASILRIQDTPEAVARGEAPRFVVNRAVLERPSFLARLENGR